VKETINYTFGVTTNAIRFLPKFVKIGYGSDKNKRGKFAVI
jgi:hypothetical protein